MQAPPVPEVIRDLYREPGQARVLVVAAVSLVAAGLEPRVYSPGLASVQAAVRESPGAEQLLLIAAVVTALALLVGGFLGDTDGRRQIHIAALATLVATGVIGLVITDGPIFLGSRIVGAFVGSIILPFALAAVAVTYRGIARATAIGLAYAAYGGAMALSPVLLTLFGPAGPRWPAFVAATIAAVIAVVVARRDWPDLPTPSRRQRRRVVATVVWAAGIIVTCVALVGFGRGEFPALRLAFFGGGLAIIALAAIQERGVAHDDAVHVERRPVAMALLVGFVIAFAQSATLLQLPLFFQLINGYGPVGAIVATVPFIIALIVTGPIVGILLGRISPRPLITIGVLAVGIGNLLLAAALAPRSSYLFFILPLVAIGAGFVIATTVRTAIIFASVPRGLPATAAALNEASVAMGTRAGLVVGTLVIATLSVSNLITAMAGQPAATIDSAVAVLRELLVAIGSPAYGGLVDGVAQPERVEFAAAYTDAVREFLAATGIVTVVAAGVTWILVGRRDPLTTVWEHKDERVNAPA